MIPSFIFSFVFNLSLSIEGAVWRGLFVALLALIAFALVPYWQSLSRQSLKVRGALVGLRAVSLLLVACALAGVRLEYDGVDQPRILVYAGSTKDDVSKPVENEALVSLRVALRNKNFEVVEQVFDSNVVRLNQDHQTEPYRATIFLPDEAMPAVDLPHQVERASAATGGTPVYLLTDFQQNDSPRVSLDSITLMSRPARGIPFAVRCTLHARGMKGRSTLVTLADDAQVRSSAQASWNGDDEWQTLTLEVVPKAAGWINYLARAEAAGGEDASTLSRPLTIYAEERRQRVLFFEGEPTWEAKFIRRALGEAEIFDVDYFAQVSRAAVLGAKEQGTTDDTPPLGDAGQGEESAGEKKSESVGGTPEAKLRNALAITARLNAYDCIIVGATPDTMLSNAEAVRLREWVERRGGGLVILGGNAFAGSVVAPNGKLSVLLPAEIDSGSFRSDAQTLQARSAPVEAEKSQNGQPLTPTATGGSGALRGLLSASQGQPRVSALTGQGIRLGALRAGASVLAVTGQPDDQGTSEAGAPLIAAMRYGMGRALVFAPSDSWRLRTGESGEQSGKDGAFAALWQGLTLWTSAGARPPVEVILDDESPAAGSVVTAEIRARDESHSPLKIEKLNARLQSLTEDAEQASSGDASSQELAVKPDENDASIWRARFVAPPSGRFNLEMNYTAGGKSGAAQKYFAVVAPFVSSVVNTDTLRRAARATGGEFFAASDLNSLLEKLTAAPQSGQTVRRTIELRAWWPLALIIPFLLSCEWLISRMKVEG